MRRRSARDRSTGAAIEVDDRFVGGGYGVPTPESRDAIELVARSEGILLDPTYTAKAMAGLIAYVRRGEFTESTRPCCSGIPADRWACSPDHGVSLCS